MSNRQLRRHPTHPFLSIQYPSNKRVADTEKKKTSSAKTSYRRGRRKTD